MYILQSTDIRKRNLSQKNKNAHQNYFICLIIQKRKLTRTQNNKRAHEGALLPRSLQHCKPAAHRPDGDARGGEPATPVVRAPAAVGVVPASGGGSSGLPDRARDAAQPARASVLAEGLRVGLLGDAFGAVCLLGGAVHLSAGLVLVRFVSAWEKGVMKNDLLHTRAGGTWRGCTPAPPGPQRCSPPAAASRWPPGTATALRRSSGREGGVA